jgi:putative membrane protein
MKVTMNFFAQTLFVMRLEGQFFTRFPRLLAATLLVALIPSLYIVIYLSSVWDPVSRTAALPVALVNLDEGIQYREHSFNVGKELVAVLRSTHTFGFMDFEDEEVARARVRDGSVAFALIVPRDFSSNAVPGQREGAGRLVVYASQGNNFESAAIASNFAAMLGRDVNEKLNERRWSLVLSSAAGSQQSVDRLREGVAQLRQGSAELSRGAAQLATGSRQAANGATRLSDGVDQLVDGMRQLGTGLRTMDAKRPRRTELDKLKSGAEELAAGHLEFGRGLGELKNGSHRLSEGVATFRDDAASSVLVPTRVIEGLEQVHRGSVQLDSGIQSAVEAEQRLTDGAGKLSAGVGALTTGVTAMNTGIRTMVSKLPEESRLDELDKGADSMVAGTSALAEGSVRLKTGAEHLTNGLDVLANSLPTTVDKPEGSATGLANSVRPNVEMVAAVPNSGSAFASNIIPAALWLGAGIAAFLIHVRVLPRHAQMFLRPAQLLGKFTIPLLIVLAQSGLVLITVLFVLKIQVTHIGAFALCLLASAVTFLAIVFALTRALGDAGKALSMIFLAVQLSSSGGIVPVELSGGMFAAISPWLPLTWVVRAMKATMFGAYDSAWQPALLVVLSTCLIALAFACWVGRWRYVKSSEVRPSVDF